MPQDTGRAPAQRRDAQPTVGAQAPCQNPSPWSGLRRIIGAQAHGQCQTHGQCSGPWSGLKPMASTQAHGRGSGLWSVFQLMVDAQAPCQYQAHGQGSGPWSVPGLWSGLRPLVGAPVHCWCSSPWPVPSPWSVPGVFPVPQRLASAPAHWRYAQSMVGAHTEKPRTGAQHHARLSPTRACRRRQTSSARASLRLFAAPDAWRSAAEATLCFDKGQFVDRLWSNLI